MTDRRNTPPKFIYFDLGNVLLFFDYRRACRQLSELTGVGQDKIWDVLFTGDLQQQFEKGRLTGQELYETFQRGTGATLDFETFAEAYSDIFQLNTPVKAILGQLVFCGYRLGVLSNTNELHWRLLTDGRYALLPNAFEQVVLSHEVGAVKPEPAIFEAAIQKAGTAPGEIFYMDDMPGHVASARACGIDAIQYTDPTALADELRRRGVEFNY